MLVLLEGIHPEEDRTVLEGSLTVKEVVLEVWEVQEEKLY